MSVQEFPAFYEHTVVVDGKKVACSGREAQDVLQDLHRFHEAYGRIPTSGDFKQPGLFGNSYTCNAMIRHFKVATWRELLKLAGFAADGKYWRKTREEMLENLRSLYEELQRPIYRIDLAMCLYSASLKHYVEEFGSFDEACRQAGVLGSRLSSDKRAMLAVLREYFDEFGHAPRFKTFCKANAYHNNRCAETYTKCFGSWADAIKLALQEK
jgi:sulfur relay (sulfurtransferase) DsrC/TusE family protein